MRNKMVKCSCPNSELDQQSLVIICVNALESFAMTILRYVSKIMLLFLCHLGEEIRGDFEDLLIIFKQIKSTVDRKQIRVKTVKNKKVNSKLTKRNKLVSNKKISIVEVKEVMGQVLETDLCDDESDEDELFKEELSLQEVREAFDVFDENKDGFIDAAEVQRVLYALGVMEASQSECKEMIKAFDNDGNGKIDFNEFIKILEVSFR